MRSYKSDLDDENIDEMNIKNINSDTLKEGVIFKNSGNVFEIKSGKVSR